MNIILRYILLITLSIFSLSAFAKDSHLVHLNATKIYSQSFGVEQNEAISNWIIKNTDPKLKLPTKDSWMRKNRPGKYSDISFFNSNLIYLQALKLGAVRHKKSGEMLTVYLVNPKNNIKLDKKIRPVKAFIILGAESSVIKDGVSLVDENKKINNKIKNRQTKKTIYPNTQCVKGDCMNGQGTLKISAETTIKTKFKHGKIAGDVVYQKEGENPFIYKGGFSPDSLTFYGRGTLHLKKPNVLISGSFYKGKPNGRIKVLYRNFDLEMTGIAGKGAPFIAFNGKVTGKVVTKKDEPFLLKNMIIEGSFKLGSAIKNHIIKFCQKCPASVSVDYKDGKTT